MSNDKINSSKDFVKHVSAIFEENVLHLVKKSSDIEKWLTFCSNYCLDFFYK